MTNESKYALLEVPDFSRDLRGVPLTSYLRLGAVAKPSLVASPAKMATCEPSKGATRAATGAGEDLAARVTGFDDDQRDCCDPPTLDAAAPATSAAGPQPGASAEAIQKQLESERKHLQAIRALLQSINDNPQTWLDGMFSRWQQQDAEVKRLQQDFDAELNKAAASSNTSSDPFVPPNYAAPGHKPGSQKGAYASYVSEADRQRQSARLHTLGGVRDHTDGNRITTTRGDKLEIVQGNYRMVVLGRHDTPVDANGNSVLPGWDISGGHCEEHEISSAESPATTANAGAIPSKGLTWKKRWNGNWHAVEETVKADTKTVVAGDTNSHSFGHYIKTSTGSEDAPSWHKPEDCPGGVCRSNPKISSHTWAKHVKSQMGSAAQPVAKVSDTTHVKTMLSKTNAHHQSDRVIAKTMNSTTHVGSMTTTTTAGTVQSTTVAASVSDRTESGLVKTINITALKADASFGNSSSTTIGLTNTIFLGAKASASMAASFSLSGALSASIFVGTKASLSLGATATTDLLDGKKLGFCPSIDLNTAATTELSLLLKVSAAHVELG